ncbi:MAG: NTP transferase domain-containing protein [Acidimicrobiales bacterium]
MLAGVVLAGGEARRMGGVDKASVRVGGVTLLDRVLGAARPVCDRLVVVGPPRPTAVEGVAFVLEPEPGGGPVPAVLTGVRSSPGCDVAVVLATDLPFLQTDDLRRLLTLVDEPGAEAAAAVDERGPNPLLAAYRVPELLGRAAGLGLGTGSPAGRLLPDAPASVDLGPATFNVNRPADLAAADLLAEHERPVVATALWLRRLVRASVPDAVEAAYQGWHGLGYRHPQAGYFCAIFPRAAGVRLSFEHGTLLADRHRLLRGTGRRARYAEVLGPGDPPAELLVELVDAAVELPIRNR